MKQVNKDDLLAENDITQIDADLILLNLKLTGAVVKDFKMTWVAQSGLVDSMSKMVKEYKSSRKLMVCMPMRVA